ncbi:MAG: hypothetical protein FJ225_02450 [Lentisphaerae bacterium]|nr:hypothetical protein [Lentisphaerota bacterium]
MKLLHDNLARAGKPTVILNAPGGGRLLVLPSGGRVLALYPPNSDESFLWLNPTLTTVESAAAYLRRDGWPNPGGDRTWLAPEIELFIGDPARPFETYSVQRALDPGRWALVSATDGEMRLAQTTRLKLHRSKRDIGVRMGKVLRPAVNPLPDAGLRFAGYSQTTTLEMMAPTGVPVRLGLWSLLQLPSPGTMLVPTRGATAPQKVFGAFAEGELTASARGVRWRMASPGPDTKISLKAGALTGRAGYLRRDAASGTADLVVREFTVVPGGDYVDALWEPPHETGWGFQACCVRNGAELFNELEYHAPAGCRQDESRVWAFRGSADAVQGIAAILLGPGLA